MTRSTALRPEKVRPDFNVGDRALYHQPPGDDGRRRGVHRVVIVSDEMRDKELGTYRRAAFVDLAKEEYDVPVAALEPCDRNFRPVAPTPADLRTLRGRGVETADYGQGRVYAPEPFRRRAVGQHPVMDKFERLAPDQPMAPIRPDRLNPSQLLSVAEAERILATKGRYSIQAARDIYDDLAREVGKRQDENSVVRSLAEREAMEANRLDMLREEHLAQLARDLTVEGATPAAVEQAIRHHRETMQGIEALRRDPMLDAPRLLTGLDEMLRSKSIDPAEHEAGERYGEIYAAALAGLKISNPESVGGGGAPDLDGRAVSLIDESKRLQEIDDFVRDSLRRPRATWVLRLVAGRGMCVSHFSKGASRAKNVEALRLALEVLAVRWALK